VVPTGAQLWKLSAHGPASLGLSCTETELFLAGTALVERHGRGCAVRPPEELERLLRRAYGAAVPLDRVMSGFRVVAAALGERDLCLAQIAAVQLRMPDLPDQIARGDLEVEDRLIKGAASGEWLARAGWDPAEHPRAGVPPNPGWFAPTDGGEAPSQLAQADEDERAPGEMLDPEAPVRQAQWEAAFATLREIDPANPQLASMTAPGWVLDQADLDALDLAINRAETRRILEKIMPNGAPIGAPGTARDIRELPGGLQAAQDMFGYLRVGGSTSRSDTDIAIVKLPANAGYLTFRPVSRSGDPAIDINLTQRRLIKLHFPPRSQ
jgi:hypothetical protein